MNIIQSIILGAFVTGSVAVYRNPQVIEVPVELPKRSFEQHLADSAKTYGIPFVLAEAMVSQESESAKLKKDALRYEPGQLQRGRDAAIKLGLKGSVDFDEQARQFASSHCQLQVMGYHAAYEGESWSVLHDPESCAEYGMRYLGKCLEKEKSPDKIRRYFNSLICYNGSEKYAIEVFNRLGRKLIQKNLG